MASQENYTDPIQELFSSKLQEGEKAVPASVYKNVLSALPPPPTFSDRVIKSLGKKGTVRLLSISLVAHLITFGVVGFLVYNDDQEGIQVNTPRIETVTPTQEPVTETTQIETESLKNEATSLDSAPNLTNNTKAKEDAQKTVSATQTTQKPNILEVNTILDPITSADTTTSTNNQPFMEEPEIVIQENTVVEKTTEQQETKKDPNKFGLKGLTVPDDSTESIKLWQSKN